MKNDPVGTVFFSNSNIFPESEYGKRLAEVRKMAEDFGMEVIEDDYDHDDWRNFVAGLENEEEGGTRCEKCFAYRLARAAELAKEKGLPFMTTLGVSPYKNLERVNSAGEKAAKEAGVKFIPLAAREKEPTWNRSLAVSREMKVYRQKYCGCEFSKRNSNGNNSQLTK